MAHDIEFFKAKTTLVATALAAALALVLGLMSAPATAHDCARHNNQNHKHCDPGGEPPPDDDQMGEPAIVVDAGRNSIGEVQVFDVDGIGGQVVIKGNKDEFFFDPDWAPDGLHIALRTNDRVGCRWSIRITTFDDVSSQWSTPETIICENFASDPEWDQSSDATEQRIYFTADPDLDDGIFQLELAVVKFTFDANGNPAAPSSNFLNIPSDGLWIWSLAVSPDGGTIAVTRVFPDDTTDIALFDVDTPTFRPILDVVGPGDETFWPNQIEWHPSGLYFTVSLSTDTLGTKIWCVDPVSEIAQVATDAIAAGLFRTDHYPTWSPDGTQFYFQRDLATARITFASEPLDCTDFVTDVASSEADVRFEFLLQPGGKITDYGRLSVRLP